MPGKDDRAGAPVERPAAGNGQSRGESANRGKDGASGENKPLSGGGRDGLRGGTSALGQDRDGQTALGKHPVSGAADQHGAGTSGRPFQPPAILRAPSSLLSHPLFLHPVPQLGAPFRALSFPPSVPAPLLFDPAAGAPQPPITADIAAAQTQTQTETQPVPQATQSSADVPSPKVELSVTPSAIDTAPTSVETPISSSTVSVTASSAPSPESAIASTTSDSAPDISPIIVPATSLVDTSFTNPDLLPVTNSGVGVGGKVAAACVIGAVLLLLVNWAFWLLIRRRRRARRSLPAHWNFAAPPPAKDIAGRESEDAFALSEEERAVVKGGMVTVPF